MPYPLPGFSIPERGLDEAPSDLRRPLDPEARGHPTLQDGRPARPAPRRLHHAPTEARRQVLAEVPHLHRRKHGRRRSG